MLSKRPNGTFKTLIESLGTRQLLRTKAVNGYPDLMLGGTLLCFPVLRWNGRAYAQHHFEYETKCC